MKKWIVKFLAISAAMILSLSAIGCGGGKDSGGGNGSDIHHDGPREGASLYVYALDKGYHVDWVEPMLDAFAKQDWVQKKYPGLEVDWNANEDWDYAQGQIQAEEEGEFDLLFSTGANEHAVQGYLVELTDEVYNKEVPGEGILYKDKIRKGFKAAMTYIDPKDDSGKERFFTTPWADGMDGLLYNVELLEQLGLPVPRTTDELKEICQTVLDLQGKSDIYDKGYSIVDAGGHSYLGYLFPTWWAQYEGVENYNSFYEGKVNGEYSNKIFEQKGRLYALQVLEDLFFYDNNGKAYMNIDEPERAYQQGMFLKGDGLFMPNGDWFVTETEEQKKAIEADGVKVYDIRMMRTPIISALGEKLGITDKELREIVDFVDNLQEGNIPEFESTKGLTDEAVIEEVRKARGIVHSIGDGHTSMIPKCAPNKDVAIDFLRFMATDIAQEIYIAYTKGATLPFTYDVSVNNNDLYSSLAPLHQDRHDYFNSIEITTLIESKGFPLYLLGEVDAFVEEKYWTVFSASTYKKPENGTMAEAMYQRALDYWTEAKFNEALKKARLI